MNLYIIRHAEAVSLEQSGVNADADRPLTPNGHTQCRSLASALLKMGTTLDLVLTSSYLRTRQTAQGLIDAWSDPNLKVEECKHLEPGGKIEKLARLLRSLEVKSVALVGHMTDLAEHAAWFMGSRKARLDFDKAGAAYIDFIDLPDKGNGCLIWLVTPQWYPS